MPNVTLTHTFKKVNRKEVMKKSFVYMCEGLSRKDALKKAWDIHTKLSISFYTNAKPEDIKNVIKSCQKDGKVRTELLRKWDSSLIKHPLDWVSYHLRRSGFEISEPLNANIYKVNFEVAKL
jgi:hypothetical protein